MNTPTSVQITRILSALLGLFWLAFAIIICRGLHPSLSSLPDFIKYSMMAASAIVSSLLFWLALALPKGGRVTFFLALAVFGGSAIVTIFDQVGWVDLFFMAINFTACGHIIKEKTWFLKPERP